jgi:hypothetical protein
MTDAMLPGVTDVEAGFRRLAAALSHEALVDAGWSTDELLRLTDAVAGVALVPTEEGANLILHWEDEPDEELQALAERMQESAPMLLMALTGGQLPEEV